MGRHGAFVESSVVRDDWGRFGEENHFAAPASPAASAPAASQRGMPDAISSAEIKSKGGMVKLEHHGDGSLKITTPHGSTTLPADVRSRLSGNLTDAEFLSVGETQRIGTPSTAHATIKATKSGYTLHVGGDDQQGIALTESQLGKIGEASTDMSEYSHRIDTGYGVTDVYLTQNDKLGLRTMGDDGKPVDLELSPAQASALGHAIDTVATGFDPNGSDDDDGSAVTETSFNAGKGRRIHVTQQGTVPFLDSPDGDLLIEADDGSWAITVNPKGYDDFTQALYDVVDAL